MVVVAADWPRTRNCDGITPRRNMIGVVPTIHPFYARKLANDIGSFFFFFVCIIEDRR